MKGLTLILVSFFLVVAASEALEKSNEIDFLFQAEARGIISAKQLEQLLRLAEEGEEEVTGLQEGVAQDAEKGVFMRMYNRLTLLNVLYFSGALLVMGAYTLFMTLAVERCHMDGLSIIMTGQTLAIGVAGCLLWTTDYQFLGGL